jgi:hypothetical protein
MNIGSGDGTRRKQHIEEVGIKERRDVRKGDVLRGGGSGRSRHSSEVA